MRLIASRLFKDGAVRLYSNRSPVSGCRNSVWGSTVCLQILVWRLAVIVPSRLTLIRYRNIFNVVDTGSKKKMECLDVSGCDVQS